MGIKPESGGSPPRDRRTRGSMEEIIGVFDHDDANELMLKALLILKEINSEKVITKYRRRVNRVRDGKNWIIIIIQPKCAIEE